MNGIKVGTRLDQLLELEQRLKLEIEVERRLNPPAAVAAAVKQPSRRTGATRPVDRANADRLDELGVKSIDVKRWAVDQGLIPAVVRGRVSDALIDAYQAAHHQPDRSNPA